MLGSTIKTLQFVFGMRNRLDFQPEHCSVSVSLSHLDTGFSWFSWVLEQMLGWFPLFSFPSCHYLLPM
jgi:hypothetical protein